MTDSLPQKTEQPSLTPEKITEILSKAEEVSKSILPAKRHLFEKLFEQDKLSLPNGTRFDPNNIIVRQASHFSRFFENWTLKFTDEACEIWNINYQTFVSECRFVNVQMVIPEYWNKNTEFPELTYSQFLQLRIDGLLRFIKFEWYDTTDSSINDEVFNKVRTEKIIELSEKIDLLWEIQKQEKILALDPLTLANIEVALEISKEPGIAEWEKELWSIIKIENDVNWFIYFSEELRFCFDEQSINQKDKNLIPKNDIMRLRLLISGIAKFIIETRDFAQDYNRQYWFHDDYYLKSIKKARLSLANLLNKLAVYEQLPCDILEIIWFKVWVELWLK